MLKRKGISDDIRGVGPYHSRVYPANDAELDRMHQEHGERAPWMDNEEQIEPEAHAKLTEFLRALIFIGDRKRRIFFARLQGISWAEIGMGLLKGSTPQAAEKEFAQTLEDFPDLARGFPERNSKEKRAANG